MVRKYALLVIDMQEEFRSCGAGLIPELNSTIQLCRNSNIPVIFTQHGHRDVSVDGGMLAEKFGTNAMIPYGSDRWKFLNGLDVASNDIQITEKRRYDAFYGTILESILRQLKVDTVIISGVMTNLCCETTARSAFVKDFRVVFLADGTGTDTKQMHDATLLNIQYGFGDVITCSELRKLIKLCH